MRRILAGLLFASVTAAVTTSSRPSSGDAFVACAVDGPLRYLSGLLRLPPRIRSQGDGAVRIGDVKPTAPAPGQS